MYKNWLIKGITGGLIFFFLGWFVYGYLLSSYMDQQSNELYSSMARPENEMVWWAMILSSLAIGLLIAFFLVNLKNSNRKNHFVTSAVIGLLYAVAVDFSQYSMTTIISLEGVLVDILAFTMISGVIGLLVSFVGNERVGGV